MTIIPESGVDYLILTRADATALERYFRHQYVHYDEPEVHAAMNKISTFVERVDNELSKGSGNGSREARQGDDSAISIREHRNAENRTDIPSSPTEGNAEGNEGQAE